MPYMDPQLEKLMDNKPNLNRPFHPIGGRLIVKPDEDLTKNGNIYLPRSRIPVRGVVVEAGPIRLKDGTLTTSELSPGDIVLFDPNSTMPLTLDGETHLLLHEKFVLAKLEK